MKHHKLLISKLKNSYIWHRILVERLTEPLHLNFLSIFVALFGSWRLKTSFDLILRQHNAYAILDAANRCKRYRISKMAVCEFGVASGAGLMNMAFIAHEVSRLTDVEIKVFGFDTGSGMPSPIDYRDHPELYSSGDFKMDVTALKSKLPPNAELILGNIRDKVPGFLERMVTEGYKIAYAVIDVDYYTSTCDALTVFNGSPDIYLPLVHVYLDDIADIHHNPAAGELLAVEEFNAKSVRKIYKDIFLETRRIFSRAAWLKHMYCLHILDHVQRTTEKKGNVNLSNPYLN